VAYSLGTAEGAIKITYDSKGIARARDDLGRFVGGSGGGGGAGSLASAQRGFTQLGLASTAAATAIAGGIALAVNVSIDFEKRLSAIGAVSGATTEQMEALRKKALQLGADTAFSAGESAIAMEELVKAGLSVEEVLNGAADATVALAAAGEIALPEAAAIASNAMNAFKLSAQDLPRIADLIAGAANASAISVSDFGISLSQAGAVAKLVGVSFDDLAVAIALMGNAGIKGSDAGTSLKTMLQNLQPSTKKQADLMKKLGIITQNGTNRFFDQTGKLKSLAEVSGILNTSLKGMTDAQKAMALEVIFGSDAIRAAAILAGEGAAGFNEMALAMGKVTAEEVAAKRLDNVAGAIEQLKGSAETAAIAFGSALLPAIRTIAEFITMLANKFSALDPRWQKLIAFAAVAALALAALIAVVAGVGAAIAGIAAAVGAIKIAAIVGAIVAAIVAIGVAIKLAYDRSAEFRSIVAKAFEAGKAAVQLFLTVARAVGDFIRNQLIPAVKEIAQNLIKNLQPAFQAIGDFIQNRVIPAYQKLQEAFIKALPTIKAVAAQLISFAKVVADVVGKALGFIIPILLNIIGPIFSALIGAITWLIGHLPEIAAAFNKILTVLKTVGAVILGVVIAPFYALYQAGKFVFEALSAVIGAFVSFFTGIWNFMFPIVSAVWGAITAVISAAWAVISGLFQIGQAIIMAIWNAIWGAIGGPVTTAFNFVRGVISAAMAAISDVISAAWNFIKGIWDKVFGWVSGPVSAAFNFVKDFITSKMDSTKSTVSSVWDAITGFFSSARDRITGIINGFSAFVTNARNHFEAMKAAIIAKVNEVVSWLSGLPGRIIGAIGNLGGVLVGAGRSLIQGFWDGMVGIWNSMVGWLQSKMSTLRGLWPFSPAKWGPFSGRGWVLYSGRALMEGFATGMDQRVGLVNAAAEKALAGVAGRLPTDFSASVSAATGNAGMSSAFGTGPAAPATSNSTSVTEININVPLEDLRSIRDVQDLLDFIDRLRNDSRRGLEEVAA
jgi:TP901 family phage tail tape measure protein